ncbi:hypothetical protein BAX98_09045 [Elizabethkingia anophelis]|nr:hypothetical protein BAX98_09045 [Elizabethkingia anophelis]
MNDVSKSIFFILPYYISANDDFVRRLNTQNMVLLFKGQQLQSYIYYSNFNRLVIAVVHPEKVVHDLLFMYNRFECLNERLRFYKAMKRKYEGVKCSNICCCPKF